MKLPRTLPPPHRRLQTPLHRPCQTPRAHPHLQRSLPASPAIAVAPGYPRRRVLLGRSCAPGRRWAAGDLLRCAGGRAQGAMEGCPANLVKHPPSLGSDCPRSSCSSAGRPPLLATGPTQKLSDSLLKAYTIPINGPIASGESTVLPGARPHFWPFQLILDRKSKAC